MRTKLFAVVALFALVATACGNSGDDTAADETETVEESAPEASDAPDEPEEPDEPAEPDEPDGDGDFSEFVSFEETGVTDTEIRVATITAATNPLGGPYGDLNEGIKLYFDQINGAGGLYGRELVVVNERDDLLGNNLLEAEGLVSQDNAYAAFVATILFTGANELAEDGIPTFGWNISADWSDKDMFFPNSGALCIGCVGRTLPWLTRELGATNVAVLAYGVDQSKVCAEGTRDSYDAYDVGAEVVFYDDALSFGQLDFSAQVSAMADADVDFVMTCMDRDGVQGLKTEMFIQGVDAVLYHPNLYDADFVRANADLFEGDYIAPGFAAFEHETDIAAITEFLAAVGDEEFTELTVQGWIAALQFVDALKATGPEFPRAALIETWNSQPEAYSAAGWLPPIDWTFQHNDPSDAPEVRSPLACVNLVQVVDGELVSVFTEGDDRYWLCFDATVDELGEPELMSFAD